MLAPQPNDTAAPAPHGGSVYPRVLLVSLVCWALFATLAVLAASTAYLPGDLQVARWIQSASWGPLGYAFPWISMLSGIGQVVVAILLVIVVGIFDRPSVRFALAGALGAGLYWVINIAIHKPRPSAALVHVVEHPGAYAFPSGHATLATIVVAVLVLTIGVRRFNRVLLAIGAVLGVLVAVAIGIERIYVGAHYPSDVIGGVLLALATLSLALSVPWISSPVIARLGMLGEGLADG